MSEAVSCCQKMSGHVQRCQGKSVDVNSGESAGRGEGGIESSLIFIHVYYTSVYCIILLHFFIFFFNLVLKILVHCTALLAL